MANNVTRLPTTDPFADRNLALIRRTVASDCNNDEFDLFVHTARHLGLDPMRKQIYAFVFSKDDAKKRKMSIVTGIDGFRAIAERTGDYLPDDAVPAIEYDPALACPANPLGIVKATVRVKKFRHGEWHSVAAEAFWVAYARIKDPDDAFEWKETGEFWTNKDGSPSNRPKKRKVRKEGVFFEPTLDTSGRWPKDPRGMIAKCAEALALRKAWPDVFSGAYIAEEMDRSIALDLSPSEAAATANAEARLEKIGAGKSILADWMETQNSILEPTPIGKFADRAMAFLKAHADEPSMIATWQDRDEHSLREFWGHSPGDALELKKAMEGALSAHLNASDEAS